MLGQGAPQALALGQLGSRFINDTTSFTGQWGVIQCIAACTFTTLTSGKRADGKTDVMLGSLADITLAAGQEIRGLFTTIKLASGSVIAYEA